MLSFLGEVLLTLGVLVLLYIVYLVWWSNFTAQASVRQNSQALLHSWQSAAPGTPTDAPALGQSFGFLYIPALGPDYRALLMQGTDRTTVLNTGAVGHYTSPASAMPWDPTGNFALAGHRDGHGMVFRDLDRLTPGDKVYVRTDYGWFVYELDREAPSVPIDDAAAVLPIPAGSGYTVAGRYLTMTTCTPMYVDTSRLVWWGHLVEQTPRGQVPAGVTPQS